MRATLKKVAESAQTLRKRGMAIEMVPLYSDFIRCIQRSESGREVRLMLMTFDEASDQEEVLLQLTK
jgi:hypothetical protein